MAQIRCDVPRLVIEQWRKPQMVAGAHSQPREPSGPHVPQLHFGSGVSRTTGTTVQAGSWTGELPPIGMLLNPSHSVELGRQMEQVAKVIPGCVLLPSSTPVGQRGPDGR